MSTTNNRRLKLRDTFTKLFPTYTHGTGSNFIPTTTHATFMYKGIEPDGIPTHNIDRTYTHKVDFMKYYTEEMLKISNMRRVIK